MLLLNDRGTPADLTDDIWTDYPVREDGTGGSVVIDAQGRTWFGNSMGLFRYTMAVSGSRSVNVPLAIWQRLKMALSLRQPVVTAHPRQSLQWQPMILLLQFTIEDLVESRAATLRTANRNHIWTVAPDESDLVCKGTEIHRRDALGLQSYTTPIGEEGISAIEVDSNNHVWVIYQSSLWRMSAKPDFLLDPTFWLVAPGHTYSRSIRVGSSEGYRQIVGLEVAGLSEDFEVTFEPESVAAGSPSP